MDLCYVRCSSIIPPSYQPCTDILISSLDGSPARSAEVTVTIDVLDANDNMPMFLQSSYSATVFENVDVGTTVRVVKAEDKDEVSAH